jgi:exodeoxyribonuclease-5
MFRDFQKTGAKVLFVGDSYQLPPVKEEAWFMEMDHDNRLDEIVRQAADSGIIRLSEQIRTGDLRIEEFKDPSKDAWLCHKEDLDINAHWMRADQVITGRNESRQKQNRFFRKQLGRNASMLPVAGDRMICLKNDHRRFPPWVNGVQFTMNANVDDPGDGFHWIDCEYEGMDCRFQFYPYHCQITYQSDVTEEPHEERRGLFEADYAYSITVHKSQGSEWPFVIVADDKMRYEDKDFRRRWLYTAVTRAKERVIISQ